MNCRSPLLFAALFCALFVLALPILVGPSASAQVREPVAEISGEVVSYSTGSNNLTVNTRLGPKLFVLTATTLVLLNNHSANEQSISTGDQVRVEYFYPSFVAKTIHLTREAKRRGRITAITDTTLALQLSSGATINFSVNDSSHLALTGIALTDSSVLLNRRATVVYEPSTTNAQLLLSLAGEADQLTGRLASTDATANTLTLRTGRTLRVDAAATLRRADKAVSLSDLRAGDKLKLALAGSGAGRRVLALRATPR